MNNQPASPWIVNTSDGSFEQDVIQRSAEVTVVVDFWADWCGPCRLLGPILESLAMELDGRFVLVKANLDATPQAAAQFRVQSIPAVYAVRDGRVVDGFLGAMPEPQVREWLNLQLPSDAEQLMAEALATLPQDPSAAEMLLRSALMDDPKLDQAKIHLARLFLDQDRIEDAQAMLAELEQRGFLEPDAERIKAAVERHAAGEVAGSVEACRASLAQAPDNLELQLRLAGALAAAEEFPEALETCLNVVRNDTGALREQARKIMVDVFHLLPDDSDLARDYRRKLSMALF